MKTSAHEDNCTAAQLRSWAKAILCQRDCEPHDYGLLQQHIPGRLLALRRADPRLIRVVGR